MAEPSKEVERPTASQGINRKSMESNRKSHLELQVPSNPHNAYSVKKGGQFQNAVSCISDARQNGHFGHFIAKCGKIWD